MSSENDIRSAATRCLERLRRNEPASPLVEMFEELLNTPIPDWEILVREILRSSADTRGTCLDFLNAVTGGGKGGPYGKGDKFKK